MLHRGKAVACSSRNVDSSMSMKPLEHLNWKRGNSTPVPFWSSTRSMPTRVSLNASRITYRRFDL